MIMYVQIFLFTRLLFVDSWFFYVANKVAKTTFDYL